MPDVRCSRCGERWDLYELHDVYIDTPEGRRVKVSFTKAWRLFKEKGCEIFEASRFLGYRATVDGRISRTKRFRKHALIKGNKEN